MSLNVSHREVGHTMVEAPLSTDVGTKLLFEDDRCRVWLLTLGAGQASDWHLHPNPYVYVATTPGQARTECVDGTFEESADDIGTARLRAPDAGHRLVNLGGAEYRNIIVELKAAR
jgi:beta-alanine degradation protein BauB